MKTGNKIYIILSIFFLITLVFAVFGIGPLLNDIKKSSEGLVSAKMGMVALQNQIEEIENFKKNYDSYKDNLENIDNLFVDPGNPVDFIEFLENTASDYGLESKISFPSNSDDGREQNFLTFQISTEGSFSSSVEFIKKIESGQYLVEIEDFKIKNDGIVEQSDYSLRQVITTLNIKTFVKK